MVNREGEKEGERCMGNGERERSAFSVGRSWFGVGRSATKLKKLSKVQGERGNEKIFKFVIHNTKFTMDFGAGWREHIINAFIRPIRFLWFI